MPDIPLLQPTVLRGVIEKMTAPEELVLTNRLPRTPWPYPAATWDIIKASRLIAAPNVPNSEAHIVPRLGRGQGSASFIYLREKKVFEPTTIHWLRTPGQLAARNAEASVLREIGDLNQRFDNFLEWACWQALTGVITLDYPDVQASVNYKFATSHKPTVGTTWATATPQQIIADVKAWTRLIRRDSRVAPNEVWTTEPTLSLVFESFAKTADSAALISDRLKDQYYSTGTMPNFLNLNWNTVESVYEDAAGAQTLFLPDGALVMANLTTNRPMEIYEGPSADDEAPENFTGKFSKTWKDKDPSARQYLLEWNLLPVITRPEQIVYVADVTP